MNFPSIRIEGSILSPDILDRFEKSPEELAGQRATDFGLDPTLKVKDEIARTWADAQDYWRIFQRKIASLRPGSPATSETRQLWIGNLLGMLGYTLEYQPKGLELNGRVYNISHRVTRNADLPLHIIGYRDPAGLDRKPTQSPSRMSAHAMVQEYINLHEQLYGMVSNGRVLRLLRDSSRLIKLSYLEFDLDRIFTEGLYADFAVMYRLLHASRLPVSHSEAAQSLIERYHQDSLESGSRIRDGLSRAVKSAIEDFGNGFLAWPGNETLRQRLAAGRLEPLEYYRHLLRLIYRLLFLMVVEERDLVFPPNTSSRQREIYTAYYSLLRLRRLAEKPYLAEPRRHDLWQALMATFRLFEAEGPGDKLGLKPLGGDLFQPIAIGPLNNCQLSNEVLLTCLRALSLYQHRESRQLIRVNYAALNVEELGSVYEGLLELRPLVTPEGSRLTFALVLGDERAATSSHYTPDELVQPLIKHSLDHLIAEKLKEPDPARALLSLRVADVSCGSGHILLAAARRIALELAFVRTGEEQPSPAHFRAALRDVIRECIYGVDLNPLAVELCKVALWLEAHSPGEPLNFLDHHIKCGNAIVGFVRREELEKGVPDEAFTTQPGDDKTVVADYRRENRKQRKEHEQSQLKTEAFQLAPRLRAQLEGHLTRSREIARLPERTPAEITLKKQQYQAYTQSEETLTLSQIAAIPIAQFYLTKTRENRPKLVTDEEYRAYLAGHRRIQGLAIAAWSLAEHKGFFHWFLEFPDIIDRGGFDCILGNPPYKGGTDLSGKYGRSFCEYVKWAYHPTGLSDLVAFFVRRIFGLLKFGGYAAIITTNSIIDGDIRRDGIEQVIAQGGTINMAVRAIKWPGRAKLVVSQICLKKGTFEGQRYLDGRGVGTISSFLEDHTEGEQPKPIHENAKSMLEGSKNRGEGFFLEPTLAKLLIAQDVRHQDVIRPILSGSEITDIPDQSPQRFAVFFRDWEQAKAETYPDIFELLRQRVMEDRVDLADDNLSSKWWLFERPRIDLYLRLQGLSHCFALCATAKYMSFAACSSHILFTHGAKVFTTSRWDLFTIVQSTLHEVWARKYSGALETRLRYSPSNCFSTFPFPRGLWQTENPGLAALGEQYHEHRRQLMLSLWLGLTDVYNLFHARDLSVERVQKESGKPLEVAQAGYEGLLELRRLHRALDLAVRDAYGWSKLELGHDFHAVETLAENDRIRYTISPAARKQVLAKLLALNLERAGEEAMAAQEQAKREAQEKEAGKATGRVKKGGKKEGALDKSPSLLDFIRE